MLTYQPLCCNSHSAIYRGLTTIIQEFQAYPERSYDWKLQELLDKNDDLINDFKSIFLISGVDHSITKRQESDSSNKSAVRSRRGSLIVAGNQDLLWKESIGFADSRHEVHKVYCPSHVYRRANITR